MNFLSIFYNFYAEQFYSKGLIAKFL